MRAQIKHSNFLTFIYTVGTLVVDTETEGKTATTIARSGNEINPVQKPARRPLDDKLPRERVVHAAPSDCGHCGSPKFRKLDEKATETLDRMSFLR